MSEGDQKPVYTPVATTATDDPLEVAISVSKILPWAMFGAVAVALAFYFVGAE